MEVSAMSNKRSTPIASAMQKEQEQSVTTKKQKPDLVMDEAAIKDFYFMLLGVSTSADSDHFDTII